MVLETGEHYKISIMRVKRQPVQANKSVVGNLIDYQGPNEDQKLNSKVENKDNYVASWPKFEETA